MLNSAKKYDLEDRTAKFGEAIVLFSKNLKKRPNNTTSCSTANKICN